MFIIYSVVCRAAVLTLCKTDRRQLPGAQIQDQEGKTRKGEDTIDLQGYKENKMVNLTENVREERVV